MPKFTYDPSASTYQDVPAGDYVAEFLGTEEMPPFDGPSKFGKASGPRLKWLFRVKGPDNAGRTLSQITGLDPSNSKSKCFQMVKWLLGRTPQKGEAVDTDSFRGQTFEVTWEENPNSEAGNLHIGYLRPHKGGTQATSAPAAGNGNGTSTAFDRFWMKTNRGEREATRLEVESYLEISGVPADQLQLQAHNREGGWKPATAFGFQATEAF